MNDKIQNLIKQYEAKGDFTYTIITPKQIEEVQTMLCSNLPGKYLEFLRTYGHGGIGGVEIIGVGKNGTLLFVKETMKYRELGLPDNLIVIENCDEWLYCIDCNNSQVVSWSNQSVEVAYPDFDTYLLDRFTDAAENL